MNECSETVVRVNVAAARAALFFLLALFFGGLGHCTGEWHMLAVRIAPANQDACNHAAVDLGYMTHKGVRGGVGWGETAHTEYSKLDDVPKGRLIR